MEREKTEKKALTGSYKGNKEMECRGERKTGRRDGTQGMTAWSPGNPRGNKTPFPKQSFPEWGNKENTLKESGRWRSLQPLLNKYVNY